MYDRSNNAKHTADFSKQFIIPWWRGVCQPLKPAASGLKSVWTSRLTNELQLTSGLSSQISGIVQLIIML